LVYAGAGISLESGLPTGAELSREIHTRLTDMGISLPRSTQTTFWPSRMPPTLAQAA
jgi:NAD-dependent SIR2 family protein deacetylase